TGATMALGERFAGRFACRHLAAGEQLRVGDARITVLATPGHTLDSITLHVCGADTGRLLTGDTLFVGDVGRPDLASGPGVTPRAMAELLFASLQQFRSLPPDTEVWPAHGAGSACGSCIASAPSSTLAAEFTDNLALRETDLERFCQRLLAAHRAPPPHFARLAGTNLAGPPLLATLTTPRLLTVDAVAKALANGGQVLDVRTAAAFGRGHWPGSLNIGLDGGDFEPWAGALLDPSRPLVLHADDEAQAQRAWRRLLRVGLDDLAGFSTALPVPTERTQQIDAIDLFAPAGPPPFQVIDVRRPDEFAAGHLAGAVACELAVGMAATLPSGMRRDAPTAVVCDAGYRSSAAIALLRAAGFTDLHNVRDGMRGWFLSHLPLQRTAPTATS
ncbi:MAG: rhodanese-like domain-containing protein, partial [Planctomycetota bacterium]